MSDTPRTDHLMKNLCDIWGVDYEESEKQLRDSMIWNHARILERELAAAKKDSERLDWLLSGYAVVRWDSETNSRNDHVVGSRTDIDAAMRESE